MVSLIYTPDGVYIRETMSAHVTTVMWHLVISHKPAYVTNNVKPTTTTTPFLLGYKYNCKIICSRVKQSRLSNQNLMLIRKAYGQA